MYYRCAGTAHRIPLRHRSKPPPSPSIQTAAKRLSVTMLQVVWTTIPMPKAIPLPTNTARDVLPTQRTPMRWAIPSATITTKPAAWSASPMKTVRYRFAYDILDRLIAESGFDHKLTGYRYNAGNELVEQHEFGDDASPCRQTDGAAGRSTHPQKEAALLSDGLDGQNPVAGLPSSNATYWDA